MEEAVQRVQQKSWRLDNNRNNNSNVITRSHIRPSGLALLGNRQQQQQQQHKNLQFSCEIPQFPRYYIMRMHQYLPNTYAPELPELFTVGVASSVDRWVAWLAGWGGYIGGRAQTDRQTLMTDSDSEVDKIIVTAVKFPHFGNVKRSFPTSYLALSVPSTASV